MSEFQRLQVKAELPERLDRALARLLPDVTREEVKRWIRQDRVLVNGHVRRAKDRVRSGDWIEFSPSDPPLSEALPDPDLKLDIIHEDDDLLVVNKPAGMVVHPAAGHARGTLVNGLLALESFRHVPSDPRDPVGHLRPGIVHRIDKDTSGLLVVTKTARAREFLKVQFQEHSIQRRYEALVVGHPAPRKVETLHGRDPHAKLRFSSLVQDGKPAVTEIVEVQRIGQSKVSRLTCRLETGRTHQIRVHLSQQCKAPILADGLYGGYGGLDPASRRLADQLGRQALHAAELGFLHPTSGKRLLFETALPQDMQRALEEFQKLSS
ncbi:MAG: RluA family pseudouridine synthase [Polyangiaceae bacterium]|nr:RluA family pseudouridine synthase [Polyangiaceae bacterium]